MVLLVMMMVVVTDENDDNDDSGEKRGKGRGGNNDDNDFDYGRNKLTNVIRLLSSWLNSVMKWNRNFRLFLYIWKMSLK